MGSDGMNPPGRGWSGRNVLPLRFDTRLIKRRAPAAHLPGGAPHNFYPSLLPPPPETPPRVPVHPPNRQPEPYDQSSYYTFSRLHAPYPPPNRRSVSFVDTERFDHFPVHGETAAKVCNEKNNTRRVARKIRGNRETVVACTPSGRNTGEGRGGKV